MSLYWPPKYITKAPLGVQMYNRDLNHDADWFTTLSAGITASWPLHTAICGSTVDGFGLKNTFLLNFISATIQLARGRTRFWRQPSEEQEWKVSFLFHFLFAFSSYLGT